MVQPLLVQRSEDKKLLFYPLYLPIYIIYIFYRCSKLYIALQMTLMLGDIPHVLDLIWSWIAPSEDDQNVFRYVLLPLSHIHNSVSSNAHVKVVLNKF